MSSDELHGTERKVGRVLLDPMILLTIGSNTMDALRNNATNEIIVIARGLFGISPKICAGSF